MVDLVVALGNILDRLPVQVLVGAACLYLVLGISAGSSSGVISANVVVVPFAPANIVMTALSVSSGVTTGAQLQFNATLNNTGYMAGTNVIVHVNINGPVPFNAVYSAGSLSPNQGEFVTLQISGATSATGTYTLNSFATYVSNSVTYNSNTKSASYTVASPGPGPSPSPGGGGGGPPPIKAVPGVTIGSIPILTSTVAGQGLTSQISIRNNQSVPELINFTIGQDFSDLLTLSTNSIYLQPGQTGLITATFKTLPTTQPGTYVIPLNITVNDPVTQTEYLTFTVYSNMKNGLQIVGQTFLTNSLSTLSGVITIQNSGAGVVRNGTLTTMLPSTYVKSASQISAFGLPNNVTLGPNGYVINWQVSKLQPGQIVYAYYTVLNQTGVEYLSYPQNIFSAPSQATPLSIIKVVDISSPSLISNSSGYVNVSVFYTGTSTQQISFYLAGSPQSNVANPVQTVNASPNQLLKKQFYVSVGNYTGTMLFYLYITSSTANLTESVPVIISPRQTASTTASQQPVQANLQKATLALEAIAVLTIVLIVLLSILKLRRRRPKYNAERTRNLVRLRKRITGESVE